MSGYSYIQWWQLPDSKSQLDRWSDRAIRLAQAQCFLAGILVFSLSSNEEGPYSRIHYDHEVMPTWKVLAASPAFLLPILSCLPRIRIKLCFILRHGRLPTEAHNLVDCILLTSYDFIRYAPGPVFWMSLVVFFSPALLGFLWSLIGLHRFCFLGPSYSRAVHNAGLAELPEDNVEEDGLLGQAYLLQQERPDNNPLPSSAQHESSSDQQAVLPDREETTNKKPSSGISSPPRYWVEDPQPVSETSLHNRTRFRWQERRNLRNGGAIFWTPWLLVGSMSMTCVRMSTYALTHTWGLTPEMERHIRLTAWLPPLYSMFFSMAIAVSTLYYPRCTIIFASFCAESFGVIIWTLVFVDAVVNFSTHLPYGMAIPALFVALAHLGLAFNAVNMEWEPGYSSLLSEIRGMGRQESQEG